MSVSAHMSNNDTIKLIGIICRNYYYNIFFLLVSSSERPPRALPPPPGPALAAAVGCDVARRATGTGGPLRHAGGVCYHGDGAGPRAHELQPEGSAHLGTPGQGRERNETIFQNGGAN